MCSEGFLGHIPVHESRKQSCWRDLWSHPTLRRHRSLEPTSLWMRAAPRERAGTMLDKAAPSGWQGLLGRKPAVSCQPPTLPAAGGLSASAGHCLTVPKHTQPLCSLKPNYAYIHTDIWDAFVYSLAEILCNLFWLNIWTSSSPLYMHPYTYFYKKRSYTSSLF